MATKTTTTTTFTCDVTGEEAAGTVLIVIDGGAHQVDLSSGLFSLLREYADHGRKISRSEFAKVKIGKSAPTATNSRSNEELAEIRAWARDNGIEVSGRGRIPLAVYEAFDNRSAKVAKSNGNGKAKTEASPVAAPTVQAVPA